MAIFSFVAFTLLVAGLSYWFTGKTEESSDGYFLGGRSLTAGVIAGSLLLTNLSTEQLVGLNGAAYTEGILVMCWETLAAIAMVVTAFFLLPRYLKGGLTTVPQFLAVRFDTMTKTLTSGLFLSGYMIVLLPIVLYSGAVAIGNMFDLPDIIGQPISDMVGGSIDKHMASIVVCVWSIGIIGSIYAVFGGLKAVAVSDTINAIGLLIGGFTLTFLGLQYIGDGSVSAGLTNLYNDAPERFNAIGSATASVPFSTIFTGMMLVQLFYWGTNQAIIQRALAAKNLQEGQKGLMIAAAFKILGPLILVIPGMIAYNIFGDSLAKADYAYPELVKTVLPVTMVGFFAAVIFGAILSSFNSALNSSVTLFGLDIYKQHINIEADERTVVRMGKRFGILLALGAMIIAPFITYVEDGLFKYLQEVNGCYSIPILTIIVVGYLTKYVPAIAAKIALGLGVVLYIISQFILKPLFGSNAVDAAKASGIMDEAALEAIEKAAYPHFLHVMAILFVMNVIIMLVIGKLYPRKEAFVLPYTQEVEITPYKYVKPVGITIVVIVIATYLIFS